MFCVLFSLLALGALLAMSGCAGSLSAAKPANGTAPPTNRAPTLRKRRFDRISSNRCGDYPQCGLRNSWRYLQFAATVTGATTDKSVTWTASSGQIDASGKYTAPATGGTDTITATSEADSPQDGFGEGYGEPPKPLRISRFRHFLARKVEALPQPEDAAEWYLK